MKKFISYFIPERYIEDIELNRKSRFVIWFNFLAIVVSVPIFIYTYIQRPDDSVIAIIGASMTLILATTFWIFKKTGSFILITHIFCGFFTLMCSGAPVESGGIFSPDMPTIYIVPVFAIVMGNLRIGLFYSFLMMVIFIGYYIDEVNHVTDNKGILKELPPDYFLMNLVANAFVILFIVFRNEKLRLQSLSELKEVNEIVSEKNKEITDSINYARRIQSAILPQKDYIKQNLPDSFFLYKPKDIVSGDFYWMSERKGEVFLAVADCTGHGVPGAFMSVVGMNLLNEIVNHQNVSSVSEILKALNAGVISALQQKQTETNDGMDIALLKISSNRKKLEYAAANRGLIQFRNGNLVEYKPSKYPIGGFNSLMEKSFDSTNIEIQSGDIIYLSTDGYADQFGSDKNKKITTRNFKKLLSQINTLELSVQESKLLQFFEEWKKGYEQTDDVLVVGIKI